VARMRNAFAQALKQYKKRFPNNGSVLFRSPDGLARCLRRAGLKDGEHGVYLLSLMGPRGDKPQYIGKAGTRVGSDRVLRQGLLRRILNMHRDRTGSPRLRGERFLRKQVKASRSQSAESSGSSLFGTIVDSFLQRPKLNFSKRSSTIGGICPTGIVNSERESGELPPDFGNPPCNRAFQMHDCTIIGVVTCAPVP